MQRRSLVATRAVLILALIMHALTVSTARSEDTIPIARARQKRLGKEVTVKGSVTVLPGTFNSFSFDQGFAIQDRTGGIYVSVATAPNLDLHQKVRVTGKLDDSFGLLILVPQHRGDVEVLDDPQQVAPEVVTTCDIGEGTEGRLVRVVGKVRPVPDEIPQETVEGVIRVDRSPTTGHLFGFGVFIDSSGNDTCVIQVFTPSSIDLREIPFIKLNKQIQVTGFSAEFNEIPSPISPYEVNPRFRTDIKRVD